MEAMQNYETDVNETNETPAAIVRPDIRMLKPGILVMLSVRVSGGVHYDREQLNRDQQDVTLIEVTQTVKTVDDVIEFAAASKLRADVRNAISGAGIKTAFGLLCPKERERELWKVVDESKAKVRDFNREAKTCNVTLYVLPGEVAATDIRATEALLGEANSLLSEMERALKEGNVEDIRKAANAAKAVSEMLEGTAAETVNASIKAARQVARQVVRRVEKMNDELDIVLAENAGKIAQVVQGRRVLMDLHANLDLSPGEGDNSEPPAPPAIPTLLDVLEQRLEDYDDSDDSDDDSDETNTPAYTGRTLLLED